MEKDANLISETVQQQSVAWRNKYLQLLLL